MNNRKPSFALPCGFNHIFIEEKSKKTQCFFEPAEKIKMSKSNLLKMSVF